MRMPRGEGSLRRVGRKCLFRKILRISAMGSRFCAGWCGLAAGKFFENNILRESVDFFCHPCGVILSVALLQAERRISCRLVSGSCRLLCPVPKWDSRMVSLCKVSARDHRDRIAMDSAEAANGVRARGQPLPDRGTTCRYSDPSLELTAFETESLLSRHVGEAVPYE